MRSYVTRNRLGQPFTTEFDEFVDGKPTGNIQIGSKFIDGEYIPIYKGEEAMLEESKKDKAKSKPKAKPKPTPVAKKIDKPASNADKFNKWFSDKFGDTPMPLDPVAVASYNEWVDKNGTFATLEPQIIFEKPEGEEYTVFVLEFDWHYGHEKDECKSKKEAMDRIQLWQKTYTGDWSKIKNFKIYSEIRFRKEIKITNQETLLKVL